VKLGLITAVSIVLTIFTSLTLANDWTYYGGGQGGKHYSSAKQITKNNVDDLDVAWVYQSGDMKKYGEAMVQTSTQATPILLPIAAGESLVYCTPYSRVIALDPATGAQRWDYDPEISLDGDRPFRCRGVSYAEDLQTDIGTHCRHQIYVATHDRTIRAIDSHSGKVCANFGNNGTANLYGKKGFPAGDVSNSATPVIANNILVTGSSVIDFSKSNSPRGIVIALDTHSGKTLWTFDPLIGNQQSGSANVWSQMSVDAENNLVFLPTSAPSPDYYGADRPGDNLYANSLVALDLTTGKVQWYFQHARHDLWDYDTPAQPILFQWKKDGESIAAVAQLTKQGFVFVFNRLTGESMWEITEQPTPPSMINGELTARWQPKPIAPPSLLNNFLTANEAWGLTPIDKADCVKQIEGLNNLGLFTPINENLSMMFPGSLGGPNWGGGAYNEATGILITNINNVPFTGKLIPTVTGKEATKSDHPAAGHRMQVTMHGTPYTIEIGSLQSFLGIPCNKPPWGKLVAVDLINGVINWEAPLGSVHEMGPVTAPFQINWGTPNLGGGIATAGDLFFIGSTMDRKIRAFDVNNGEILWDYTLPNDATATPMTYTYKGRQYVVINAGGHHMYNRGYGDYLYAFALPE
jgi:quinoprotein glucose dehydrogenase